MANNVEQAYVDGVVGIFIDGLVVHIDFGKKVNSGEANSADNKDVKIEESIRVTLPITGFLQAVAVVQQLVGDDKFVNIIKRLQEANFVSKGEDSNEDSNKDSAKGKK